MDRLDVTGVNKKRANTISIPFYWITEWAEWCYYIIYQIWVKFDLWSIF